jgi:nitrate reductase / nitrite oxidoreductase, alpha subunit
MPSLRNTLRWLHRLSAPATTRHGVSHRRRHQSRQDLGHHRIGFEPLRIAHQRHRQGYDPIMIETMQGAGTQTMKFRGGMPFLGATRTFGLYRFANMLALLDSHVRGTDADTALGARGWDNYSWHTDLPPGHPMVTGQQTVDFDLFTAENAEFITLWGMNWISTKMPDSHWLTEARLHGAKVFVIATEYQSTSNKADEMLVIRPGTDTALALGLARIIIDEDRPGVRQELH